jgi:hypothetical protein
MRKAFHAHIEYGLSPREIRSKRIISYLMWIFVGSALIACFSNCGIEQAFKHAGTNYMVQVDIDPRVEPLIISALEQWDETYGVCPQRVMIVLRSWPFMDYGVWVAGLSYGGLVDIGINHTSECQTVLVLWHELYHSCKYIHTHNNEWQDPMYALMVEWRNTGRCIEGETELYDPYVWD